MYRHGVSEEYRRIGPLHYPPDALQHDPAEPLRQLTLKVERIVVLELMSYVAAGLVSRVTSGLRALGTVGAQVRIQDRDLPMLMTTRSAHDHGGGSIVIMFTIISIVMYGQGLHISIRHMLTADCYN